MSTKKLQILDSMIKQAENANTLGGRSASYFAAAHEVNELHTLVGDTSVSTQISTAVEAITADDLGVYVQDTEPAEAVEGDIWIDSSADSGNYVPINHVHNDATTTTSGFMSALDKVKLDSLTELPEIIVDDALSRTSINPVQNKVVNAAIDNLNTLVGDVSVSEQIADAISSKSIPTITLPNTGSNNSGKYALLKTCEMTAGARGYNGTYLLFDARTQTYSGIFHVKARTANTISDAMNCNISWLSVNQSTLKNNLFLTQETASDTGYVTARLYIKVPSNYSSIKLVTINEELVEADGNVLTTPTSFTWETAMIGTTIATSSARIRMDVDKADTLNGLTSSVAELNYCDGVTSNIQEQLNSLNTLVGDSSVSEQISLAAADLSVNISKKAETASYTGTFSANGWSANAPYTQTITVTGLLSTDNPIVDVNLDGVSNGSSIIEVWTYVGRIAVTANNTVVGYCYEEKPTVDIPIILKVVR